MAWTDIDYIGSAAEVVYNKLRMLANCTSDDANMVMLLDDLCPRLQKIESHSMNGDWQDACSAAEDFIAHLRPLVDGTGDPTAGALPAMTAWWCVDYLEGAVLEEQRNHDPEVRPW